MTCVCVCVQEAESLVLELEELKREQTGYEQQILAVDEAMKTIQEQIDNMSSTVAENKVLFTSWSTTVKCPPPHHLAQRHQLARP